MYRRLMSVLSEEEKNKFQIICSRIRKFDSTKSAIYWAHDLASDVEALKLREDDVRNNIDAYVFVSDWQRITFQTIHNVPVSKSYVIPNAIEPVAPDLSRFLEKDYRPRRFVYHTTPHRGLELLVPVFVALCRDYPDLHLDVYSSFEIYGWGERDKHFETIFNVCKTHPNITYHGAVSNAEVRNALTTADVFGYPSIWQETSCIAAIEALCSGVYVIAPNLAALPETMQNYPNGLTYRYHEDVNTHANIFYRELKGFLDNFENHRYKNVKQIAYASEYHNWNRVQNLWKGLLGTL